MTYAKTFKIRCSQIGRIMTKPKKKSDTLSVGCKTYLKEWLMEQVTGYRREIWSKEMDKGIQREDEAIQFLSEQTGVPMQKNSEQFADRYMTGEPDVIQDETIVRDTKCPWDVHTFPYFEDAKTDYVWQGLGYLRLTGRTVFKLDYVLMDHLDSYVDMQANIQARHEGATSVNRELWERVAAKTRFSDLPVSLRWKTFVTEYDTAKIREIRLKVVECRKYLETLEAML